MGNGHEDSSDIVRRADERFVVDVDRWIATSWTEDAVLTNQISEEPSGK